MMLMDKFYNKFIIDGVLVAQTPIHIGAGDDSFDPTQVDNAVIKDSNGNPYIPGSSLKGTIRSYMETLIRGNEIKNFTSCLIVDKPCLNNDDIKKIKAKYDKNKKIKDVDKLVAEQIYEELCTICRIFGSHSFASKLTVNDCELKGDKAYIERRDGVAIDRDSGTAAWGKKYDFEQVAAGTKFDFHMTVDNLESEYEPLLQIIVNVLQNGDLNVGGRTSIGLGSVKLEDVHVYKIDNDTLSDYLINGLSDEMRWQNVQ